MTLAHTYPKGPFGLDYHLTEQIREVLRAGSLSSRARFAEIAERAGVSLDTVRRIAKNMRNREMRARKAARLAAAADPFSGSQKGG